MELATKHAISRGFKRDPRVMMKVNAAPVKHQVTSLKQGTHK